LGCKQCLWAFFGCDYLQSLLFERLIADYDKNNSLIIEGHMTAIAVNLP
jgi:hypothetical protein